MPDIAFSNICGGLVAESMWWVVAESMWWVEAKNNAYFGLSAKSLSVGPSVAII